MKARYLSICVAVLFVVGMLTTQGYTAVDPGTLMGMWLFDEGDGDTTVDYSANGNDGALEGGAWVDGKFGTALEFNGVSDYVDVGNDPATDVQGTNILSICAWVKRANDTSSMLVAIRRTPGGYVLGVGVLGAGANQIKMTKYAIVDIYLGDFPADTDWHHLAGVWDGDGQVVYVDGELNGESANTADFSSAAAGNLLIGGDTGDQGFAEGVIDDFGIFNVALSEDDVNTIMNQGLGRATGLTPVSLKGGLATAWGEIKSE